MERIFGMRSLFGVITCLQVGLAATAQPTNTSSTFTNPILPGFHPDPSCIHVPDADGNDNSPGTTFCVSSSFNAFPGIPIHASRDLRQWNLVGHVLNRREQLPRLVETNRSTSGIWAPTIRYHEGIYYVVTTLVDDDRPQTDTSRWDNLIFQSDDLYDDASWSQPVHFNFTGYDPSPFWDDDGKAYIVASHAWQVEPGIHLAEVDLDTGDAGPWKAIWTGTGGLAPEGPHIYRRDGYYYLLAAEGGTGLSHMVTMARAETLDGPYTPHPDNPVLTNANTTSYFQTVGHADLFQDVAGNWWSVALATRSGPAYAHYPMGRETVLTTVRWEPGQWPRWTPVQGTMQGPLVRSSADGDGDDGDDHDTDPGYARELDGETIRWFAPGTSLPPHFAYWRPPVESAYTVSPAESPNTLRLRPSWRNLTGLDGNYAGPGGQTFVGRRQQHTLFVFRVDLLYEPARGEAKITASEDTEAAEEAGVTVFLTQNHHLDLGVVWLGSGRVGMRFRGTSPWAGLPGPVVVPVAVSTGPSGRAGDTADVDTGKLTLEIQAVNGTHYTFSGGPAGVPSAMQTVAVVSNEAVSFGFTGTFVGVYCTSNGGHGTTPAYVSGWEYIPRGQFRK